MELQKERVSRKFSEVGTATEKAQFGLGYGRKIKSRKSNQIFYYNQTDCSRTLQILESLFL